MFRNFKMNTKSEKYVRKIHLKTFWKQISNPIFNGDVSSIIDNFLDAMDLQMIVKLIIHPNMKRVLLLTFDMKLSQLFEMIEQNRYIEDKEVMQNIFLFLRTPKNKKGIKFAEILQKTLFLNFFSFFVSYALRRLKRNRD